MESYAKHLSVDMRTVLIACCAGVFIMPLMSTMMNLALVDIGMDFGVGADDLALVNTIFLLGSVVAMVPLARISDIVGRKKIFIFGLVITAVCSVVAAFSPHFYVLLAMRFGMGAGSAAVSLTSVAMLTEVFPFERRGWAIGMQTAVIYCGSAVGPAFGGFICELLGWKEIFFFILPFTFLSMIFILRFKKEIRPCEGACMDYGGAFLFGATVLVTMFGAMCLPDPLALIPIAAGLVMFYYFMKKMKRTESPVLDFSIFRYKVFSRSCIAAYMNYASSFSVSFFMALYLQSIGALTPMQAGAVIMIQPAVQVVLTAVFGSRSDRMKDKRILPTLGMVATCAGVFMIMFLDTAVDFLYVGMILVTLGVGYGAFSAPNTNAVMSSVPPKHRGEASGMVALLRQLGMMTSMTVAMCTISIVMGSAASLGPSTPELFGSFITVIRIAFAVCFVMCVIGTAVSWFRGNNPEGISEFK